MLSLGLLYTTAVLMGLVAIACTALCVVWTNPVWRRRLAPTDDGFNGSAPVAGRLTGWPARLGSGLVSAGIGAVALVAWYGLYCTLAAI